MNFICPHCGIVQTVTQAAQGYGTKSLSIGKFSEIVPKPEHDSGLLGVSIAAVCCANSECQKATVSVFLGTTNSHDARSLNPASQFIAQRVYPPRQGKPYPVGVPLPMLEDYNEAWAIVDLSPKSSATLARRCLQSMIRDFCGISLKNLHQEIEALEKALKADALPRGVDVETVEAMKAVRDVGNIGAHMSELDGVIVNVKPGEAEALLKLIEMLFEDWYVARHKRQISLKEIEAIGNLKVPPDV